MFPRNALGLLIEGEGRVPLRKPIPGERPWLKDQCPGQAPEATGVPGAVPPGLIMGPGPALGAKGFASLALRAWARPAKEYSFAARPSGAWPRGTETSVQ